MHEKKPSSKGRRRLCKKVKIIVVKYYVLINALFLSFVQI